MKRILKYLLIFVTICFSFSCSNEQQNNDASNNYKPGISLKMKVDVFEKEKEYLLDIYYGHDFYKDNGNFATSTDHNKFGIAICFINNNEKIILDSYTLKDFSERYNDCISNNKVEYKNCYCYRFKKNILTNEWEFAN